MIAVFSFQLNDTNKADYELNTTSHFQGIRI